MWVWRKGRHRCNNWKLKQGNRYWMSKQEEGPEGQGSLGFRALLPEVCWGAGEGGTVPLLDCKFFKGKDGGSNHLPSVSLSVKCFKFFLALTLYLRYLQWVIIITRRCRTAEKRDPKVQGQWSLRWTLDGALVRERRLVFLKQCMWGRCFQRDHTSLQNTVR